MDHTDNELLFQDDGGIEYFNTIVVQPHLKLVTNQGRGFHVRCRYQTRDKVITNDQAQTAMLQSLPQQVIIHFLYFFNKKNLIYINMYIYF